ncbi:hypothetical protein [Streptomyces cavernae]|uniref:hypothetical protein n=1 Tax=Streptomyces cavernae TaxID=2259034 RepID=UPI000FEC0B22|nr:hypothetical protein [Streptomyces cavernae]
MRTARRLRGSALAALAAGLVGALGVPVAYADDVGVMELEIRPSTVAPGSEVTVRTTACGETGTAAGDASAVGAGTFALARGPGGTGGPDAKIATGRFRVPPSAQPETYQIVASCEGGPQVTGDLRVALAGEEGPALTGEERVHPHGHVNTGVGGAFGRDRDPVQTAAGVAALAVAAAGGTWLLHRRARGDGI